MKEFYIDDDGIKLHAKLDMPDGYEEGGKCPLVIVIHGLTGHMEEPHIVGVSRLFNEMGFASLRAEMYGHGKSGGEFRKHNILKWMNNAMTVADYARSLDFVTDLFVCGHSQGGLTTALLGGLMPEYFKAIIPMSPALHMVEAARAGANFGYNFDPDHIPEEINVNPEQKVSGNYLRAAIMVDLEEAISRFRGPVLLVHGDDDEAVPVQCSVRAAEKYNDAQLVVIQGDDHCYNHHLDQVLEGIKEFMSRFK